MNDDTDHPGFSPDQARTLARVLDEIVPARHDARLPGAGELGLVGHIEAVLRPTPALREMIAQGVSSLDDLATRRHARRFAELSDSDRSALLNEHASTEHAFPPILMMHVYTGYYQHPRVVEALGLEPRPPHPKGFEMAPDDLTLLDPVRRRGKLYREY